MPFNLHVDTARWRRHLDATRDSTPGLVPVAKGNGYGFGLARLADEATRLGVDTVAVGEAEEIAAVRARFGGDVLVLAPYRPWDEPTADAHEIRTVSDLDGLRALSGTGSRVVVEVLTSMCRHGLEDGQLSTVSGLLDGLRCEGVALHLPLDTPGQSRVDEVTAAVERVESSWHAAFEAGTAPRTLWVSHLTGLELDAVRSRFPGWTLRPRIGTRLWLGDRGAVEARGTVLDVHHLGSHARFGYRQRRPPKAGWLVVVAGGTAHGVALEAPKAVRGLVARAKVLAIGALAASGRTLSPFHWAGRQRWFAEPPHMQVSMLWLPESVTPPKVGDELPCEVRMTTTWFDEVVDDAG